MALQKVKTEMHGSRNGRYCTRLEAKLAAKKRRRRADRASTKHAA